MIHIGYFASIRELTGKKEEEAASAETVLALMRRLCDAYGRAFRDFCMEGGGDEKNEKISRNVNVLVNGKHIQHLANEATILRDGDVVSIFPLIAGG